MASESFIGLMEFFGKNVDSMSADELKEFIDIKKLVKELQMEETEKSQ